MIGASCDGGEITLVANRVSRRRALSVANKTKDLRVALLRWSRDASWLAALLGGLDRARVWHLWLMRMFTPVCRAACDSGLRPELSERQFRAVLAAAEQVDSSQDIITSSPKRGGSVTYASDTICYLCLEPHMRVRLVNLQKRFFRADHGVLTIMFGMFLSRNMELNALTSLSTTLRISSSDSSPCFFSSCWTSVCCVVGGKSAEPATSSAR